MHENWCCCLWVCAQPCISKQNTLPLVAMLRTIHDHLRQLSIASIGAVLIDMCQYWVVSMPCFSLYIEQNKAFDKLWRWLVISESSFIFCFLKPDFPIIFTWTLLDSSRPINLGSRLYHFSTQGRGRYHWPIYSHKQWQQQLQPGVNYIAAERTFWELLIWPAYWNFYICWIYLYHHIIL